MSDEEMEEFWDESWSCGTEFAPTRKLVEAIAEEDFSGYEGDDSVPPFLVANLPPVFFGVVVFVKRSAGWVGIAIESLQLVQGAFLAPGADKAAVFTMLSTEGPGHEYQILRTDDGFAATACSTLEFPDEVTSPETFLNLERSVGCDDRCRGAALQKI